MHAEPNDFFRFDREQCDAASMKTFPESERLEGDHSETLPVTQSFLHCTLRLWIIERRSEASKCKDGGITNVHGIQSVVA
jgi:hypothetical protein